LQITGVSTELALNAVKQVEAVLAEASPRLVADVTIDLTGTTFTITNNRESRTGYPKVWKF
jgi:hypothetical protein